MSNKLTQNLLILLTVVLSGCKPFAGNVWDVSTAIIKKKDLSASLNSVNVSNNQITINGSGFSKVTTIQIEGNGVKANLNVESKSDTQIIASASSTLSLLVNGTFNLIIGTVEAQATYPVTFTLQNGAVQSVNLAQMNASTGQVLKWNGSAWEPSSLANSQIYIGTWDASTDTPNLAATTPVTGDYYIVSVAGTYNTVSYDLGDWIMYDGSAWDKISSGSATKLSLTGGTLTGDLALNTILKFKGASNYVTLKASPILAADIILTLPTTVGTNGQVLTSNGSGVMSWTTLSTSAAPSGSAGGDLTGSYPNPTIATGLSATKIADGSVSNAQFQYISGVSSNIQTQLDAKQVTIPAGTTAQYYRGDKSWQTLDTSAVTEHASYLYFTNARVLGLALTGLDTSLTGVIAGTDTVLSAFGKTQYQLSNLSSNSSAYVTKTINSSVTATIDATSGFVLVGTPGTLNDATPKTYVDTQVATSVAKLGDSMSGDLTLNTQLKLKNGGAANYITLKAPIAGTTAYTLSLPATAGSSNQVLITDGAGGTSWSTPSTSTTPTGSAGGDLSGTYPNPTIATGLAATKIADGSVSNTVFQYLSGVTSSIQTQLNAKQATGNFVTAITGDVTATGPGSVASTVALVGGVTAANVAAGANLANAATSANTASTIVKRDASGDFTAGTMTGTLIGNATNVTGTVAVANGGTGNTTLGLNQLLYGNGTSAVGGLATTSTPSVLLSAVTTGAPTWTTSTTGNYLKAITGSGVSFGPISSTDLPSTQTITNITPGANFTLTQNSVVPFTSVESGAVANTLYLKAGNVGIGTTSPGAKLELASDSTISFPTPGLTKGSVHINPTSGTNGNTSSITFGANSSGTINNNAQAGIYVQSSAGYGTKMLFATTNLFATGAQARMIIDQTGNVGIGTTTPTATLQIVSPASTAGSAVNAITATGGAGAATNGNGGGFSFTGGVSSGAGTGGGFSVTAGNGSSTGFGGAITLTGGKENGSAETSAVLTIAGGTGGSGSPIGLVAGAGASGFTGGALNFTAGQGGPSGTTGGAVNITAGAGGGATASSIGGNVVINGGAKASTATDGNVILANLRGNVGIGTTNPGYKLHVVGAGGTTVGYFSDGTATCSITPATAGNISCSSDERLKKNIESFSDLKSLDSILKLKTVTYEWKDIDNGRHTGFLAQEVEKITPEFVTNGKDGYKQVSYTGFIPLITGSIKELHRRMETFFGEFKAIVARVMSLEEKDAAKDRAIASVKAENAALKKKFDAETLALKKDNELMKAKLEKIEKFIEKTK